MSRVMELTGVKEKTALVHRGLELLLQDEAAKRLIELGGVDRKAKAGRRARSKKK